MQKTLTRTEELLEKKTGTWISVTHDKPKEGLPTHTVFICHGITGDKVGPQRLLCLLSERLVKNRGCEVIRFDFQGSGLSSGNFIETSFESMLDDALYVSERKVSSSSPVCWVGVSTGSIIALLASASRKRNERVISISNGFLESTDTSFCKNPVTSIREGQFHLPSAYFIKRSQLEPRKKLFPLCPSISCVLGSLDIKHVSEAESLDAAGVDVHIIEKADHLFTNPFARKQLLTKLCDFL